LPDYSVGELSLDGRRYAIVSETLLPSGTRSIQRNFRATNVTDPARLRRVSWDIWGPIGSSRQSMSGGMLRTDYVQNLDTRWPKRLISKGARNAIDLSGQDPSPSIGYSIYDEFVFDESDYFFDSGPLITNTQYFDEQAGSIFAHRGYVSTQVYIPTWSAVNSQLWSAPVAGAASWYGYGRVGLGGSQPIQTRTGVTSTSAIYTDTEDLTNTLVYGTAMVPGSDRLWFINANSAGTNNNWVIYTLDSFETLSAPLQVGDPLVNATGIGPFGPFTFFGSETGLYTFTDQGKPIPLSRALANHKSLLNGAQWADPGWGWNFAITDIGLRAVNGTTDNPVGIGERMRAFTGHNGVPTAVWAERGELFVAYLTTSNDTYIYRCVFSTSAAEGAYGAQTASTGQPDFYPMHYLPNTQVEAIFSTNSTADTTLMWGEDSNMAYETISRIGRDDLMPTRVYSTEGGTWYGTELDVDPNLLKTLRLVRLRTVSMEPGDNWTVGVVFDPEDGNDYVDIGTVYDDGVQTIYPVLNYYPLASMTGRTIKPRLTQVAGGSNSSSTPPEINGQMELEYDERPAIIEEIVVLIELTGTNYTNNEVMDTFSLLMSQQSSGPFRITLPDDIPPGGGGQQRWGMVADVRNRHDLKTRDGNGIECVELTLHMWNTGQSEYI